MCAPEDDKKKISQSVHRLAMEIVAASPIEQAEKIKELYAFLVQNQELLGDSEKQVLDQLNQRNVASMESFLQTTPDSQETREAKRLLRGAKGNRLYAEAFIKLLESPVQGSQEKESLRHIFCGHLQRLLDFLQDVCDNTLRNSENLAINLLFECVDEILAAYHLDQRSFAGQACGHLRRIHEILDLIELVKNDENEFQKWIDLTGSKHWNHFKPSEVRKRLKRGPEAEKIYSLFSKLGTHPSFEGIQSRAMISTKLSEKGHKKWRIQVGGTPNTAEADLATSQLLPALLGMMKEAFACFAKFLALEEQLSALKKLSQDSVSFLLNKIQSGGAKNDELRKSLESLSKNVEDFLNYKPDAIK